MIMVDGLEKRSKQTLKRVMCNAKHMFTLFIRSGPCPITFSFKTHFTYLAPFILFHIANPTILLSTFFCNRIISYIYEIYIILGQGSHRIFVYSSLSEALHRTFLLQLRRTLFFHYLFSSHDTNIYFGFKTKRVVPFFSNET